MKIMTRVYQKSINNTDFCARFQIPRSESTFVLPNFIHRNCNEISRTVVEVRSLENKL